MARTIHLQPLSKLTKKDVINILNSFDISGEIIDNGNRNTIKIIDVAGLPYNIKAFKVPNFINKIVYRFFRKSKAERSFLYANKLLELGINTPQPEAYVTYQSALFFGRSYYISTHLNYDFTIRKLIDDPEFENYETIVREFTKFTFKLHEKGVKFLDHSPGNTLIKKELESYKFYLVDLNRMKFKEMSFEERMQNFARLSSKDVMLDIMSNEYSKLINKPESLVKERMSYYSNAFRTKFKKKQNFKKKYFFWRHNKN